MKPEPRDRPARPAPAGGRSAPLAAAAEEPRGLERFSAQRLDFPAVRALFERLCSTALGRRTLAELAPRHGPDARAALERVRELCAVAGGEEPSLGDLCDAPALLAAAREERRALSAEELSSLLAFLRGAVRLAAWGRERAATLPEIAALFSALPDLSSLALELERGLDGRGGIRDDASPKLARLREAVRQATQALERRAQAIANRPEVRVALADGAVARVGLRDGRLVLAVKAKSAGRVRGLVHDRSQSGETVFIEPAELVEEGNRLAAARSDEGHEVQRLLVEWTRSALDRAPAVERQAVALGELELALVGARFCKRYGARAPALPDKQGPQELILRQARHPLLVEQELCGELERCVPVDLRLGGDFDILVITGPNTGGKTLALKTAGLAGLLARLGLPFPCAAGSQVPLYGAIVADIGDEQEIEQSLSTFSAHLRRIAAGLPLAGPTTLFLLDELGGGTDPADGAALGTALLDHLRRQRAPTLASTHIGRLKEFAFRHARVENACAEFDAQSLRPLYTLLLGTPGESRALAIARRLGFAPDLIQRAEALVERPPDESRRLMEDIREARTEAERSRSSADATRARIAEMERELELLRGDLLRREQALLGDAERVLEGRLAAARSAHDRGLRLLEQLPAAQRQAFEPVFAELGRALSGAALSSARQQFLAGLRKGDTVYVPRYQKRCPVLKLDREKGRVKLRLGKQELELPLDDISAYEEL